MHTAICGCCGVKAAARDLDDLRARGWELSVESACGDPVVFCPACEWQRRQAEKQVKAAVEAAQDLLGLAPSRSERGRFRSGNWFWS